MITNLPDEEFIKIMNADLSLSYRSMGMMDCMNGNTPKSGMSESYYQAFATQYEKEQISSAGESN